MIIIQDDSTRIEKFAAQELAAYASEMTGGKTDVVNAWSDNAIYIGSLPDCMSLSEKAWMIPLFFWMLLMINIRVERIYSIYPLTLRTRKGRLQLRGRLFYYRPR